MLTELGLIAGNDVMALDPECYRAHDAMCRLGEHANNLDQPTEIGPDIFARTIPQRLGAMETLPAIVRAHLDNPSVTGSALFEALAVAGARAPTRASRRGPSSAGCSARRASSRFTAGSTSGAGRSEWWRASTSSTSAARSPITLISRTSRAWLRRGTKPPARWTDSSGTLT